MTVFLFDRTDMLVDVFASTSKAERWMEPVDVANGEYSIAYLADGTCLTATTDGDRVVLTPTGKVDDTALRDRLRYVQRRESKAPAASEPTAFAAAWLAPRPSRWRRHSD